MASTLTSDEMIALALLHGCEFYQDGLGRWFVHHHQGIDHLHPLEKDRMLKMEPLSWGWPTREELARDYCEWFGLLEEPA